MTALVKAAHDAVKAADPTLRFGISPQGNPDNDLTEQYSDVTSWLTAEGEDAVVDYLCPQIYWGFGYTLKSGSTRFAFENIVPAWSAMPRSGNVALYFGLGAYRVGTRRRRCNEDSTSQWSTGSALAKQVEDPACPGRWRLGALPVRLPVRERRPGAGRRRAGGLAGQTPEPGQNFGENRPKATRKRGFLL